MERTERRRGDLMLRYDINWRNFCAAGDPKTVKIVRSFDDSLYWTFFYRWSNTFVFSVLMSFSDAGNTDGVEAAGGRTGADSGTAETGAFRPVTRRRSLLHENQVITFRKLPYFIGICHFYRIMSWNIDLLLFSRSEAFLFQFISHSTILSWSALEHFFPTVFDVK